MVDAQPPERDVPLTQSSLQVHCDGAADVLDCLYALSALEVAAMSPNEWDFGGASIPPLGTTPNTKPSREGLVIVDGVTIVQPLLDALAAGIIDVPMIVQTMAAETDFEPKSNVANWTAHDFSGFVTSTFSGWGPRVVDGINAAYANTAQENAAEAYYALDADIGITCGSAAVAVAASSGAPVYLAQVVQPPAHPYPFFPGRKSLFPFHMFDFITAFGTWGLPYLPGATYTPGPTDLALGAMLRTAWLELATTGEIAAAPYQRVNATSIVTAVLRAENPTAEVGWKTAVCAELDRFELGQRYWWVN
jgi:carboxylesterase type B